MENNLKFDIQKKSVSQLYTPISLEFYGLPGCGKSTISHSVAKKLRKQGFAVNELTYILDHEYSPNIRRIIKLYLSCKYLLFNKKSFCEILHIIKTYKKICISDIANIMPKCYGYKNSKQYDILIWDEGLIQSSVSSVFDEMPDKCDFISKEILKVVRNKCNIIGVFIDFPIELTEERMLKRDSKDSRADRLEGEERTLFLKKFKNCLFQLKFPSIHITDYKKSSDEIAQIIVQCILDSE